MEPGRNEAKLVVIDGKEAVEIQLTQNRVALIDAEDWERVRHLRWYAAKVSRWYAHACPPGGNEKSAKLKLHRVVMSALPGQEVDHIGSGLDNRKSKLRFCDQPLNQQNTGPRKGTSRFKGVSWYSRHGKWRAAFNWRGKTHFVGYFADEVEAAKARDAVLFPLARDFSWLNFPEELSRGAAASDTTP